MIVPSGRLPLLITCLVSLAAQAQQNTPLTLAEAEDLALEQEPGYEALLARSEALAEQAVVNLIDNAVKFSPEGGTVEIAARVANGRMVISVGDRGTGIDQKHLPRLFERFYRVDRARSRELGGTGLGLAIVKHVAQAHGGSVGVDSQLGVGSTFFLYFPAS